MQTKLIFCANEQSEATHELELVKAGTETPNGPILHSEIIATCQGCGRQLKIPAEVTPQEFENLLVAHKQDNEGQEPMTVAETPATIDHTGDPIPAPLIDQTPNEPDTAAEVPVTPVSVVEPPASNPVTPGEPTFAPDLSDAEKASFRASLGLPPEPPAASPDDTTTSQSF